MNVLAELRKRFAPALSALVDTDLEPLLAMIRPAQDSRHGDYQANCAMPMKKLVDKPPRDIAQSIVDELDVADLCHPPEIAGPGFINLKLRDEKVAELLTGALDERLGVSPAAEPRTIVIDYSSPNVAKPMHVGHIRSTVIGDALARILRFLGHNVITDNHLGDWGTQFGMIIYGYKHFVDQDAFSAGPVAELSRLYRLVNRIIDSPKLEQQLQATGEAIERNRQLLAELDTSDMDDKRKKKEAKRLRKQIADGERALEGSDDSPGLAIRVQANQSDQPFMELVAAHPQIAQAVLDETAKLHAGDKENVGLWHAFLPHCRDEIQRVYARLDIQFDYEYGESFYHDQLQGVIDELGDRGMLQISDGAACVFLDGFDAPMIVRKQDGAFLYATTDIATIQYRMDHWQPDVILYVVDFRQSEHFDKLFAAAKLLGHDQIELQHIKFGTVKDKSGKPYKTRSGDTVGLEGLLDDAVNRALHVVNENSARANLDDEQKELVSRVVGHGAIKYFDLNHNRESDYVFDLHEMTRPDGNTATYMQYAYARICGIFAKGGISPKEIRELNPPLSLATPAERRLAIDLLRFEEVLKEVEIGYLPNLLTSYLYENLAKSLTTFYDQCSVIDPATKEVSKPRLLMCDLAGRTIRRGLELLGIEVIDRM